MHNAGRSPGCSTRCGAHPPTSGSWHLDNAEAISAVQWLTTKVIAAIDDNEPTTLTAES
jgi:hypothetical protein